MHAFAQVRTAPMSASKHGIDPLHSWLQVRGVAGGAAATVNWLTNALVAQTFLTLTQWVGASGAFWLYAVIALIGLAWVYQALPETAGDPPPPPRQLSPTDFQIGLSPILAFML